MQRQSAIDLPSLTRDTKDSPARSSTLEAASIFMTYNEPAQREVRQRRASFSEHLTPHQLATLVAFLCCIEQIAARMELVQIVSFK